MQTCDLNRIDEKSLLDSSSAGIRRGCLLSNVSAVLGTEGVEQGPP